MKHIKLAYKNGILKELFDNEVRERVRAEVGETEEREICLNMLTDTDRAIAYASRVHEIKTAVKAEISSVLGFDADVGFDPNARANGITDQIAELTEALNMILEGETE